MNKTRTAAEAVARLRQDRGAHAYRACPFGFSGMYLGVDRYDRPTLFVPAEDKRTPIALRTDALSLTVGQSWHMYLADEVIVGRFHILCCEATDTSSMETFLLIVDALAHSYPERPPSREELTSLFRNLTRLFRLPREQEFLSGRQGLWAELFMMQHLGGAARWSQFWHSDPYRRWDFTHRMRHIEVKSTVGPAHAHVFAHRQLFAPPSHTVAVASLLLQPTADGLSLCSLIDVTRNELRQDINSLLKLEAAIRSVDLSGAELCGPTFAADLAAKNFIWYWADAVPHFSQAEPTGVSNTHYRVDLSTTPPIAMLEVDAWVETWD